MQKKRILSIALAASVAAGPAFANPWRDNDRWHRHEWRGGGVAAGLVGGLAIGAVAGSVLAPRAYVPPPPVVYAPPPAIVYPPGYYAAPAYAPGYYAPRPVYVAPGPYAGW